MLLLILFLFLMMFGVAAVNVPDAISVPDGV